MLTMLMTAIAIFAVIFVTMGIKIVRQGYRYSASSTSRAIALGSSPDMFFQRNGVPL